MKKVMLIMFLNSILVEGGYGQVIHSKATNIIDRTDKMIKNNVKWTELKDSERVDGYTRIGNSIFGGEIACNIPPLRNIDIQTFKVYPGTKYAKDKNHVYFPIKTNCVDYTDCGVCYYSEVVVENANPLKFNYLGKDYASDGMTVYFRGKLVDNADASTFRIVDGPEYLYFATDKNHVYYCDKIFDGAEPSTFYYTKKKSLSKHSDEKFIIGDKDCQWEYTPPDEYRKIK